MIPKSGHTFLLFSLLAFIFLLPESAIAEESEPFFKKDYARSPSREPGEPLPPATIKPEQKQKSTDNDPLRNTIRDIAKNAREARQNGLSDPLPTPAVKAQQMQVVVVGAVLDSTSSDLLNQQITDMLKVLEGSKILISTIYAIGPRLQLPIITEYGVGKHQGRIIYADELPEKYNMIKQSPSWIISSLDQEIVIEGAGLLSENLTGKGDIISKAQRLAPDKIQ